jgi:hypothetical protein
MTDVGTLAWAKRTGGRIDFRDRLMLMKLAAGSLLAELPDLVTYRLGLKRNFPAFIDLDSLKPPDTRAARAAEMLLAELTPPFLLNHSLRTYWFSRVIGLGGGTTFDDEMLYVASLTHDLGFYGRYAEATQDAECFSIRSARAAGEIAETAGWDRARAERLQEAIILNVNGHVPPHDGTEAHLMMRGVLVDATGLHAWRINPQSVDAIFDHLPRLDLRAKLGPIFRGEADRHPQCRGYFAETYMRFGLLIRTSPWKG